MFKKKKDHIEITQVCNSRVNQHLMPLFDAKVEIFNITHVWRVAPDICKVHQAGLDSVSNFIFASEADAELFCEHYSRLLLENKIYDGSMTAKEVAAICGKEQN